MALGKKLNLSLFVREDMVQKHSDIDHVKTKRKTYQRFVLQNMSLSCCRFCVWQESRANRRQEADAALTAFRQSDVHVSRGKTEERLQQINPERSNVFTAFMLLMQLLQYELITVRY